MKFSIKDFFSKCDQIRRKLCAVVDRLLVHNFPIMDSVEVTSYVGGRSEIMQWTWKRKGRGVPNIWQKKNCFLFNEKYILYNKNIDRDLK